MQSGRCFRNSDSVGKTGGVQWPSNHRTICGSVPCERNSLCLLSDTITGFLSKTSVNQATFKCQGFWGGGGGAVTDIWGVGYRHHVFLLAFVNHRATERGGLCGNFPVLQGRVTLSNIRKNQSLDCVWFAAFETNLALCISLWNSEVPGKPYMPEFGEVNFCLGLLIINPVSIAVTMAVCTFHKHRDDASYFQCRARAEPNME